LPKKTKEATMNSSYRRACIAALLALFCLLARPAAAALVYGYLDPALVLDTRADRIWLPVDASNDDVARFSELGPHLHFAFFDEWRALWASNFDVPVPVGRVAHLDGPINAPLIELIEFMGGGLTDDCFFAPADCHAISGWTSGSPLGTYEIVQLEYWAEGSGFAIASLSTIGSYPFPNPCDNGLPTCSDTRFLVMSAVPVPAALWLLGGALCTLGVRVRRPHCCQQHRPRL
jgi:hypothetical protein